MERSINFNAYAYWRLLMLLLISAISAGDADQADCLAGTPNDGVKPGTGGGPVECKEIDEIASTYAGFGFRVERTGRFPALI